MRSHSTSPVSTPRASTPRASSPRVPTQRVPTQRVSSVSQSTPPPEAQGYRSVVYANYPDGTVDQNERVESLADIWQRTDISQDPTSQEQANEWLGLALAAEDADGVSKILDKMGRCAMTTLDLNGQVLGEGSVEVLISALSERFASSDGFVVTDLDFTNTLLSSPKALLTLLKEHCFHLKRMAFAGMRPLEGRLSMDDARLIVDIALQCPRLIGISLTEPGLGRPRDGAHDEEIETLLHRLLFSPHTFELKELCWVHGETDDVSVLSTCLAPGGCLEKLEVLEFMGHIPRATGEDCADFLRAINAHQSLIQVCVPWEVFEWYIEAIRTGDPEANGVRWSNPHLEILEPFFREAQGDIVKPDTLVCIQVLDALAQARACHKTEKMTLALCLKEIGLFSELRKRTLSTWDVLFTALRESPPISWPATADGPAGGANPKDPTPEVSMSEAPTSDDTSTDATDSDEETSDATTQEDTSSSSGS